MRRVRVNGVDLDYEERGSGVPVVFSHGGHSDLRYWEPQREAFAGRHRYVAYTRRFHGSRTWPADGDNSAAAHVADLLAAARGLDAGPVHVVGFSADLALRAVVQEPSLVRSLTVVEPNLPSMLHGDVEGEAALGWWRDENARVTAEADGDVEHAARLWFELVNNRGPGTFDAQPEPLRRMWLENFGRSRPDAPAPEPLTREMLNAVTTPTLALGGEFGMPYSRRIVAAVSGCLRDCRLVVVPGATHFMSYQDPDAFNEIVLDFLAPH